MCTFCFFLIYHVPFANLTSVYIIRSLNWKCKGFYLITDMQGKYYWNKASRWISAMFQKPFLIDIFYESRVEDHHLNENKNIYEIYISVILRLNNQYLEFHLHSFNDMYIHLVLVCIDWRFDSCVGAEEQKDGLLDMQIYIIISLFILNCTHRVMCLVVNVLISHCMSRILKGKSTRWVELSKSTALSGYTIRWVVFDPTSFS